MMIPLAQRVQSVRPSATLAVTEKARQLRDAGVNVIAFAAGEPDFDTPEPIKQAAVDALHAGDTKYPSPAAGRPALRQAICAYLRRYGHLDYQPDQVCVTQGAKDALYLAFQALLNPGDEVIIPAPYWVSYPDQVLLAGGTPVCVHSSRGPAEKLTPDDLRRALTPRTRALVLNSPSNPSGAVYSAQELGGLADVLRPTSVLVISDEIYNRLVFENPPAASFAAVEGMQERTITVNGLSKTFAMTGWRIGFAAGPRPVLSAMGMLVGQITSGVASFIQTAATAALAREDGSVESMRLTYKARGERMHRELNRMPGLRCPAPAGAFYCFVDASEACRRLGVADADGLAEVILEKAHVAVVSGGAFGCPMHLRLSFATSDANIEEGLRRLGRLLGG